MITFSYLPKQATQLSCTEWAEHKNSSLIEIFTNIPASSRALPRENKLGWPEPQWTKYLKIIWTTVHKTFTNDLNHSAPNIYQWSEPQYIKHVVLIWTKVHQTLLKKTLRRKNAAFINCEQIVSLDLSLNITWVLH